MYVLVREDLTPEQICVQSIHAAISATQSLVDKQATDIHLVLCKSKSEDDLINISEYLSKNSIKFEVFREPDIGNSITAIATEILTGDQRIPMRKFKLLKFNDTLMKGKQHE